MQIKPYDKTVKMGRINKIYKQMADYLIPNIPRSKDPVQRMLASVGDKTVLSRDFFVMENNKGKIVGFIGLVKSSKKKIWQIISAILPEYIKTGLLGNLLDAILDLGQKQNAPELRFFSNKQFTFLNNKFEEMGFKPVQYSFTMRLNDFGMIPKVEVPLGFIFQKKQELNPSDLIRYTDTINEAFRGSFDYSILTVEEFKQYLDRKIENNDDEHYFVLKGDKVIGICSSDRNLKENKGAGYISAFCILPSYQHQGIGSALLTFAIQSLHEKGCELIHLDVLADNDQALVLYRKFGFNELDSSTHIIYSINPKIAK